MLFQQQSLGIQRGARAVRFSPRGRGAKDRPHCSVRLSSRQTTQKMDKIVTPKNTSALVFAATMALAGFLLFQVQPLLGKYILPWFGGSASTWLVCMLFFQVALLAGYAYAYAITLPLPVPRQAQLQLAILVVSLRCCRSRRPRLEAAGRRAIRRGASWRLLAVSVGVPYLALATTTPLLSRWLARIEPSLDPVRFFAASNLGSFLGLLSYPFAVRARAVERSSRRAGGRGPTSLYVGAVCASARLLTICARTGEPIAREPRALRARQRRSAGDYGSASPRSAPSCCWRPPTPSRNGRRWCRSCGWCRSASICSHS